MTKDELIYFTHGKIIQSQTTQDKNTHVVLSCVK